jgi:hypothetical protein
LAPFVVGDKGGGDDEDSENAEKNLHSVFRIARVGRRCFLVFAEGGLSLSPDCPESNTAMLETVTPESSSLLFAGLSGLFSARDRRGVMARQVQ